MAPFIENERRDPMIKGKIKEPERGDYCFLEYRPMVLAWKKSPRWTTADQIYRAYLLKRASIQDHWSYRKTAPLDLAWQVFFSLHVLPYERSKRQENGEVSK